MTITSITPDVTKDEHGESEKSGVCKEGGQADNGTSQPSADQFFRYKLGKQICLVVVWMCMGVCAEMVGPTLPDLKDRIGINYEEIARALVGRSFGVMIGSIFGGFINEIFYSYTDLLISLSLVIIAFATALTPWSQSVLMAGSALFANGFAEGVINTGGNLMVMHLWGAKATAPMHSLHFGFGFGAVIAPAVAWGFLSEDATESSSNNNDTIHSNYSHDFNLNSTEDYNDDKGENMGKKSRIEIPFFIAGLLSMIFSTVILWYYCKGPPEGLPTTRIKTSSHSLLSMASPGSCANGQVAYGLSLFICLFLYFFNVGGADRSFGKFLFSYSIETELLNKNKAALLNSLYWGSFTLGRLLAIPLTNALPLKMVMIGDIVVASLSTVVLAIFGKENALFLWVCSLVFGIGSAPLFPHGMAYANLNLAMNSVGVMVLMVGASTGGLSYQLITGWLFENKGPHSLMYVMVTATSLIIIAYMLLVFVATFRKEARVNNMPSTSIEVKYSMT